MIRLIPIAILLLGTSALAYFPEFEATSFTVSNPTPTNGSSLTITMTVKSSEPVPTIEPKCFMSIANSSSRKRYDCTVKVIGTSQFEISSVIVLPKVMPSGEYTVEGPQVEYRRGTSPEGTYVKMAGVNNIVTVKSSSEPKIPELKSVRFFDANRTQISKMKSADKLTVEMIVRNLAIADISAGTLNFATTASYMLESFHPDGKITGVCTHSPDGRSSFDLLEISRWPGGTKQVATLTQTSPDEVTILINVEGVGYESRLCSNVSADFSSLELETKSFINFELRVANPPHVDVAY